MTETMLSQVPENDIAAARSSDAPTDASEACMAVQQPIKKHLIQLWYHDSDVKLLQAINPYLRHLFRRLGPQVGSYSFGYRETTPKAPTYNPSEHPYDTDGYFLRKYEEAMAKYGKGEQDYQEKRNCAICALEQTVLFVPCVSPRFLESFESDIEWSTELAETLENPGFQIMPLIVRPTETGEVYRFRPLCTYDEGHALETAMKEFVAFMETILRTALHLEPRKTAIDFLFQSPATIQATIPSERTTSDLVLEMLEPVRELVEQASIQMAEARQLVIAERSQATQHPSRLARWFKKG